MHQTKRWYQDKNRIYAGLARSNWVTSATDWFMSFAGKAVELVLYATVLYSCAQLYPGVHLPESLSLAVFLVQMGALDIGGLSLGKLARQAHEDGNDLGATHARRLSIGLIAIMLVGVATVGIERVIPLPEQVQTGVQLVLVIARSVGSVLYGRVVHDLKPMDGQAQSPDELNEKFSSELTEALAQVKIESMAIGKPKLSLVPVEKLNEEAGEFSNKGFIESYVAKHPEARNAEIIDEAAKVGLTLSQSYVSQIRKALKEQAS